MNKTVKSVFSLLLSLLFIFSISSDVSAEETSVSGDSEAPEEIITEIASGSFESRDGSKKNSGEENEEESQNWIIDPDYKLTVSGMGFIKGYSDSELTDIPWSEYKHLIKSIAVDEGIKGIGFNLFRDCVNATKVSLPSTLTKIDGRAFESCYSLQSVVIPANVNNVEMWAFANCKSLVSVLVASTETKFNNSLVYYNGDGVFEGSDNVTIFCKRNSNAQKYASHCGIPFSNKTSDAGKISTLMAYAYKSNSGYLSLGNKKAGVTNIRNGRATLSWSKIFPWDKGITPDSFMIYAYNNNINDYVLINETTNKSCTLSNLTPGGTYKFKVVPILNGNPYDDEYRIVVQFKAK